MTYELVSFTRQQLAAEMMCLDLGSPIGGGEAPCVWSTCRPALIHTDQALWAQWTLCDACIPLYPVKMTRMIFIVAPEQD